MIRLPSSPPDFAQVPRWLQDIKLEQPKWQRSKWVVASVVLFILVISVYQSTPNSSAVHLASELHIAEVPAVPYPEAAQEIWRELLPLLEAAAPGVMSPGIDPNAQSEHWKPFVDEELLDTAIMSNLDVFKMAQAHEIFMEGLLKLPAYTPTQNASRRGIVTVAGGDYMPAFVVSLRMLRRTGSTLPVEIWMADSSEYEPTLCEEVFPSMNAQCRTLSDIFHPVEINTTISANTTTPTQSQTITHFQYKIFAILFSSFTEVLFLDSDSFPLHDPAPLFTSPPYTTTNMLTWPDLWSTSISPIYYSLTHQMHPPPISIRASTESGQLLINKATHLRTLYLTAYYNYYGPSHYYVLLCQGGYGRGDKSTFLPAAILLNQSFHDIAERPRSIGQEHQWLNVMALLQFDPVEDYNLTSQGIWRSKLPTEDRLALEKGGNISIPRVLFLHANDPKWNPAKLFATGEFAGHGFKNDPTKNKDGENSWAFLDPKANVRLVDGVERKLWEESRWVACELEDKVVAWKGQTGICERVEKWFEEFLDTEEAEAQRVALWSDEVDEDEDSEEGREEMTKAEALDVLGKVYQAENERVGQDGVDG